MKHTIIDEWGNMPDIKQLEEARKRMERALNEDGIPICFYCGKKMKHWTPRSGKFKGQEQKHSFICNCEQGSKIVLSVG